MVINNTNTDTNSTNANLNPTIATSIPTMSEEAIKKLKQRIAQREAEHAADAAARSMSSSTYIALKAGQSFKGIFTGNVDEQEVTFPKGDGKPVKRYKYEVLLLEDEHGNRVQPNFLTTFSASKTTSEDIDKYLKVGSQKLQIIRYGSTKTNTRYDVVPLQQKQIS